MSCCVLAMLDPQVNTYRALLPAAQLSFSWKSASRPDHSHIVLIHSFLKFSTTSLPRDIIASQSGQSHPQNPSTSPDQMHLSCGTGAACPCFLPDVCLAHGCWLWLCHMVLAAVPILQWLLIPAPRGPWGDTCKYILSIAGCARG